MEKNKENLQKKVAAPEGGEPRPEDSGREDLEKQKAEYLAGWQRERADFLNYKKEEMERIKGFMVYAGMESVLKILPILDNFDVAEKKLNEELKKDENIKGFLQIKNQILEFLKSQGIEEIKSVGDSPSHKASDEQGKFDPKYMEAVEEVEVEGRESGVVIEEIQKGYKINGELLRPAKVKIIK